jgi:RNA polymerase sigma factor (sigma-70 family)
MGGGLICALPENLDMAARRRSKLIQQLHLSLASDQGLTDGELLDCFLNGQQEGAFEAIVRRHGRMVLGVCQRILRNSHDADDAFQATFLVLVRKGHVLLTRQTIGDWLHGVAVHTALKARTAGLKRRIKERQASNMPQEEPPAADLWRDLQPLLDQELGRLPEKYRKPIVLCDLEGKTRKEVADLLGWPEGTVSGRLARGRVLLAGRLARKGVSLSGGGLAILLAENAAAAPLPAALIVSTTRAASLVAGGQALGGAVPAPVAALTDAVVHSMAVARLKLAAVLLLTVGIIGTGSGFLTWQMLIADQHTPASSRDAAPPETPSPQQSSDRASNPPPPPDPGLVRLQAKVPLPVLEAVLARFPGAQLIEGERDTEAGKVVYDLTIKHAGQIIDLLLTPQGSLVLIEKEVTSRDLPDPVSTAIQERYPQARFKKVTEVFKVENERERLHSYDVLLNAPGKRRTVEVSVAPDGTILSEEK